MSIIRTVARSIFEEDDDSTYVVPNYLYDNIVKKTNKDKIDLDDVLTMSLELWLHESEDLRIRYLNLKSHQIERQIQKRKTLVINNTQVYFDSFKIYPYVDKAKNIYQVRVDYNLQGLKVASSIEFDLKQLCELD